MWNSRAFTRLALQWILDKGFKFFSFQLEDLIGPLLLFFVTMVRVPKMRHARFLKD